MGESDEIGVILRFVSVINGIWGLVVTLVFPRMCSRAFLSALEQLIIKICYHGYTYFGCNFSYQYIRVILVQAFLIVCVIP